MRLKEELCSAVNCIMTVKVIKIDVLKGVENAEFLRKHVAKIKDKTIDRSERSKSVSYVRGTIQVLKKYKNGEKAVRYLVGVINDFMKGAYDESDSDK